MGSPKKCLGPRLQPSQPIVVYPALSVTWLQCNAKCNNISYKKEIREPRKIVTIASKSLRIIEES